MSKAYENPEARARVSEGTKKGMRRPEVIACVIKFSTDDMKRVFADWRTSGYAIKPFAERNAAKYGVSASTVRRAIWCVQGKANYKLLSA
jgi:hypothetical protein